MGNMGKFPVEHSRELEFSVGLTSTMEVTVIYSFDGKSEANQSKKVTDAIKNWTRSLRDLVLPYSI
jgi:hypothetical protein